MKSADGRFDYLDLGYQSAPAGSGAMDVHRFAYRCRSYPDRWCSVNLRGRGHDLAEGSWTWDGNIDKPTLAPSINCHDCWHGFIEAGVFKTAAKTPEASQ
jgi:hypothetical protein